MEFGERPRHHHGGQTNPEATSRSRGSATGVARESFVSSRAGGEGINLQVARRLLHLDVP